MGHSSLCQAAFPHFPPFLDSFRRLPRRAAVLLAVSVAAAAVSAQSAPASLGAPPRLAGTPPAGPTDDNAWLARTGSLYYSTARAGLNGFDCAVHPDWRALFTTASPGTEVSENDAHVALLNSVKIALHAHMQGGSTMDWSQQTNPDKPLDEASNQMLAKMHAATEQTLEGFLQFWTPFVDGSVVPDSAQGLTITHTDTRHTIHAEQGDMALTETFSSDLLLENFDVDMKNVSIKFRPAYQSTGQGLLVKSFQAHVQPAGVGASQAQDMHVEIEYQTLDGFPIPAKLNMDVANSGNFHFVLDGCTVSRLQQPASGLTVRPALQ